MRTLQSGTAALAKTHPRAHCIDQIECFMEAVDDTVTPKLDGRRAHKEPGLTPMQKAWARDGAVWLEEFLPASLCDRYKHFWYKHSPGPGGWGHPTPYVEHEQIRDIAMYPPVMDAMQELIGGEMVLHLTLTGFKSTTRSWHQDDYLNAPCVNSWYTAVWIALDDVHEHADPFQFVPGSHRWPLLRQKKVKAQMNASELSSPMWPTYSERIIEPLFEEKFQRHGLTPLNFVAKKGDVLIWHGRLAHQGSHAINNTLERRSLIAHYTETQHHLCNDPPLKKRDVRAKPPKKDAKPGAFGALFYNFSTRPNFRDHRRHHGAPS